MGKKSTRIRRRDLKPAADGTEKPAPAGLPEAPALPTLPWVVALWYAAGAVTLWAFGYTIMRGSDLWWHLAAGEFMAKLGGFLYTDPWSYTFEGKPWLEDSWLSDQIYHWWVVAFGLESLAWFGMRAQCANRDRSAAFSQCTQRLAQPPPSACRTGRSASCASAEFQPPLPGRSPGAVCRSDASRCRCLFQMGENPRNHRRV